MLYAVRTSSGNLQVLRRTIRITPGRESSGNYSLILYDEIIDIAYAETPVPEPKPGSKKGRKKRGKVMALVDRLKEHKASVCLFIKDFAVQFDNNQAERDLRMTKAKTKISGCFRTLEGAQEYLDIMSYASTARKLGFNAYMAIKNAISGDPMFIFA